MFVDLVNDPLHHDDRTIHDQAEVYGSQAHQVGRDAEQVHHRKGEEHGERDHRSDNEPCPVVAEEDHQDEDHDQASFDQVPGDCAGGLPDQLGTVEVGVQVESHGEECPHLLDPFLHPLDDLGSIGTLEHEGDPPDGLPLSILGHGTEPGRRGDLHIRDITDQDGHVIHGLDHDRPDLVDAVDQPVGTDVIGLRSFFYVTPSRILVVHLKGIENLENGDVHLDQGAGPDGNLVLLELATEAADLHDAGDPGQVSFHDPVLYGPDLHGIVIPFISWQGLDHILIDLTQAGGDGHHLG